MLFQKLSPSAVSVISLCTDSALAVLKLSVGFFSGSHALVSDGVHSCTDIIASLFTLIGISLSSVNAQKTVLFILSSIFLTTSVSLSVSGIKSLLSPVTSLSTVSASALTVSVLSLLTKEVLFLISLKTGKRFNNQILIANARHHQSDVLACLAGFIGILLNRLGFCRFDSVSGILISLFVLKIAVDTFIKGIKLGKE